MRSKLNALVTEKSLAFVSSSSNADLTEKLIDFDDPSLGLKNLCVKVTSRLSQDVDEVCNLLDVSKRRFLEAAIIDAIEQANRVMQEEGVFEALEKAGGQ